MVHSFLILFFTTGTVSICNSETIDDLVQREGLFYLKFTDIPFNGELEGIQQGLISEGRKQGQWLEFWVTGQLKSKGMYNDGKKTGTWLFFYTNGQLLEVISQGYANPGYYQTTWDARDYSSGIYIVRFIVGSDVIGTRKVMLVK